MLQLTLQFINTFEVSYSQGTCVYVIVCFSLKISDIQIINPGRMWLRSNLNMGTETAAQACTFCNEYIPWAFSLLLERVVANGLRFLHFNSKATRDVR